MSGKDKEFYEDCGELRRISGNWNESEFCSIPGVTKIARMVASDTKIGG